MELISLDSSFQPVSQVDNYSSLIWTERYSSNGDFELKSNDVAGMMAALPRGTCVALRESTVPMIVEDYKIDKPFQAAPVITITGRSYETVLERRVAANALAGDLPPEPWMLSAMSPSDAAFQAIRAVISDPLDRYAGSTMVLPAISSAAITPLDKIPEIELVTPADLTPGPPAWAHDTFYFQDDRVSYVYGNDYGIYRAIKPPQLAPADQQGVLWDLLASVSSAQPWVELTQYSEDDIVTYSGSTYLAISTPPLASPPPDSWQWRDVNTIPEWVWSAYYDASDIVMYGEFAYKALIDVPSTIPPNWVEGKAPIVGGVSQHYWEKLAYEIKPNYLYNAVLDLLKLNHHGLKAIRPGPSGSKIGIEIYNGADLTNEVMFDASFDQFDEATYLLSERGSTNVAYVFGPSGSQQVTKTTTEPSGLARRVLLVDAQGDPSVTDATTRRSRALIELYKFNATAVFDGRIADQIATGYNTQYHLGDIIKLVGEYGLSVNVRVEEFIRSSDSNGYKAYPAFAALE